MRSNFNEQGEGSTGRLTIAALTQRSRDSHHEGLQNAFKPVSTNCIPMDATMSPMKRVTIACVPPLRRDPTPITRSKNRVRDRRADHRGDNGGHRETFRSVHGRQGHNGRDRPRSCGKHDERSKRIQHRRPQAAPGRPCGRREACRTPHDHPSDDPEHIQRDVEDAQNLRLSGTREQLCLTSHRSAFQ